MPLDTPGLTSGLTTLFSGPPSGFDGCAEEWGDVVESYSTDIVPISTAVAAAVATLKTDLEAAFRAGQADGTGVVLASQLETAFATFAATVGVGMLPLFSATPPPGLVGWLPALQETPFPETHAIAANKYSSLIDTWMRTGTATRTVSPFDTVPWS